MTYQNWRYRKYGKFTIDGARMYLSRQRRLMDEIKLELREIIDLLERGS
jgi:hypothetical protein